jgi:23S rRNA pseudouridine2605 synthase
LGDIREGDVVEIKSKTLREQLGERMIEESGANFDAPLSENTAKPKPEAKPKAKAAAKPAQREWISSSEKTERARARLDTKPGRPGRDGKAFGKDRDRGPDRDRADRKPFGPAKADRPGGRNEEPAASLPSAALFSAAAPAMSGWRPVHARSTKTARTMPRPQPSGPRASLPRRMTAPIRAVAVFPRVVQNRARRVRRMRQDREPKPESQAANQAAGPA